jgi:hypothetical protein
MRFRSRRWRCWLLGALLSFGGAGSSLAVDGVLEINAAGAAAGGITAGDAAGYPVTLSQAGSYRLTSNLAPPDQNTNVIEITAPGNVVIDLNGFSILGTSVCTPGADGHVTSCTNTGSGNGISASGSALSIQNGLIQGMGARAIAMSAASGVSLIELGISSNGAGGVEVGPYAFLRNVIVGFNGGTGVSVGLASRLIDSGSSGNDGDGLVAGVATRVTNGQYADNASTGITVGGVSVIRDCRVVSNQTTGISVGSSSLVVGCMVSFNGGVGIDFGAAVAGSTTGYQGNVISGNVGGERTGTGGTELGSNICGSAICP